MLRTRPKAFKEPVKEPVKRTRPKVFQEPVKEPEPEHECDTDCDCPSYCDHGLEHCKECDGDESDE